MTRQPVSPICPADDIPVGSCIVPTNQTTPTTEPPKVPGWYWIKPFPSGGAFILRAGEKQIAAGWYEKDDHTQYAGPIPEPGCDEGE